MRTTALAAALLASLSTVAGCAVGSVDSGAYGSDGVKSSPSTFAEILAGAAATAVPSACVITSDEGSCAGTIIAPSVVLTAGHCVAGRSSWRIVCPYSGDADPRQATESAVATTYPGGGSRVDARLGSDLALLKLNRPYAQSAVARVELDPVGSRPRAVAVGRVGDTDRLAISRQFAINYLEPTRGYAFAVDRVIIAPADAGGGLFDPETMTLYGVSSSSVAVTACRARGQCTLWAALAPAAPWIRSRLDNWGQSALEPTGGDVGEEPADGGAPPADAGAPPADSGSGDIGDPGDTGEEPPPSGSGGDAGASMTPPSTDPCAAARDCASCTAIAICGFCNGRCTLGLPFGPLDSSVCAGEPWQWQASACR